MTRNERNLPAVSPSHVNVSVARDTVALGFPVLPLDFEKQPKVRGGFRAALMDTAAWQYGPWLVGIPTSWFWVLDLDQPLESCVPRLCSLLRMEWQEITGACRLIVRTPSGGLHLYWPRTPGVAIRTSAGDIAEGIDTRGHNAEGKATGYIVAPGCVLPDGRAYEIVKGGLRDLIR